MIRDAASRRKPAAARWTIPLAALTAVLAVFGVPGCGSRQDPRKTRTVLLIVIDTLRGDRTGYAGYGPAITPALDSLAASGVVFTDAMTPAPLTLPAVTSLLTGRLPLHHGVRDNEKFVLPEEMETLASRFHAAGWKTGAVLGSAVLSRDRGLARGFDAYDDAFAGPYPVYDPTLRPMAERLATSERRADIVTDRALEMAASFGDAPAFLLVHYFDAHMFYDPPPAFAAKHPGRPYDAEVSFVDHEIGRLLREMPRARDALLLVVSDHGESHGEHGEPQHGFLLYQSTLHVAALAAGPGIPAHRVRRDVVSLIDFEPTLGKRFGLPRNGPRDGRILDLSSASAPRGAVEYAEAFHPLVSYGWSELRALRDGKWKLVAGAGRTELYDLEKDPLEAHDLAATGAARPVVTSLSKELSARAAGDDPEAVLAAAQSHTDPARTEMLQGLGYIGGGVSAPHAGNRPHPRDALPRWLRTQDAKSLFKQAYLKVTSNAPAEAIPLIDQALDLDPALPDLWYLRGYARREMGDLSAARADVAHALALDPNHKAAGEEMDLLDRMAREARRHAPR